MKKDIKFNENEEKSFIQPEKNENALNFSPKMNSHKKSQSIQLNKRTCSICLIDIEKNDDIQFLDCFHSFHKNCINSWFLKKKSCPNCKLKLSTLAKKRNDLLNN